METINVVDAKSRFSELISRASSGERFIIRRRERDVAVLISPAELEKIERASLSAHRLALALGQDEAILQRIERGESHPVMAAFGLWKDDPDLAGLADEIRADRDNAPIRPGLEL
jgi:prevent-host-death family protein